MASRKSASLNRIWDQSSPASHRRTNCGTQDWHGWVLHPKYVFVTADEVGCPRQNRGENIRIILRISGVGGHFLIAVGTSATARRSRLAYRPIRSGPHFSRSATLGPGEHLLDSGRVAMGRKARKSWGPSSRTWSRIRAGLPFALRRADTQTLASTTTFKDYRSTADEEARPRAPSISSATMSSTSSPGGQRMPPWPPRGLDERPPLLLQ